MKDNAQASAVTSDRSAASRPSYDAVVVGAGPNGLSAAVLLAKHGLSTLLVEAGDTLGGGARTKSLVLPGFTHDLCSSVHPLGLASPFFSTLPLAAHGLEWVNPPLPVAHVVTPERAVALEQSVEATVAQFPADAGAYRRLVSRYVSDFGPLLASVLGPLRFPKHPLLLASFGLSGLRSLEALTQGRFRDGGLRALLAGIGAHAMLPLDRAGTTAFTLVLAVSAHAVGWPVARGGSQAIADALASLFRELGGEVLLGFRVTRMDELPPARVYLFDTNPGDMLEIARDRMPTDYVERVRRFRYGPGVFKVDWALDAPIPWNDPSCARAATVHLSGSFEDVARAEAAVSVGELPQKPFVILTQPSLFDPTRAPPAKHVAWAYCHVPHGSSVDMTAAIESEIEAAAPGFRKHILARFTRNAGEMQAYNPNYVGGDINGGSAELLQLFFRPVAQLDPYSTPAHDVFLCSSSTPPGGGVHGMCGYWAARSALQRVFGMTLNNDVDS